MSFGNILVIFTIVFCIIVTIVVSIWAFNIGQFSFTWSGKHPSCKECVYYKSFSSCKLGEDKLTGSYKDCGEMRAGLACRKHAKFEKSD